MKGLGDPFTASWPLLEYTLRGIKLRQAKDKKSRAKKRLPVTPDILRKLREVWSKDAHLVDNIMLWAVCCMCFYGFLRSGEVTLTSGQEYDHEADLSEGDVALDDLVKPTVVRVHIKASKTDPFRQGVFVYLGATGNDLCPVAAVPAYLAVRGRDPGPFFRFVSGTALMREALVRQLRAALSQFDMDVSQYSGHSFRIGGATTAAAVGLEDSLIKTLGRWQSMAYQLYVRLPRKRLASVCCLSVVKLLVCVVCIDNIIMNISIFAFNVLSSSCMFLDNISSFCREAGRALNAKVSGGVAAGWLGGEGVLSLRSPS